MKRRFFPLALVVLGFVGAPLPFHALSISSTTAGGEAQVAQAAFQQVLAREALDNAWTYRGGSARPGRALLVALGVLLLWAALLALRGMGRGLSITTLVFAGLSVAMVATALWGKALVRTVHVGGLDLEQTPGLGFYVIASAIVGVFLVSVHGTIRPERRRASA